MKAKLANGAEIALAYYLATEGPFTIDWGDKSIFVPPNNLKYSFMARGWPFASPNNKLRLTVSLESSPTVESSDDNADDLLSATTDLALRVRDVGADIQIQLYRSALIFGNQSEGVMLQPSGSFRSAHVSTSLAQDFRSITIDFPYFDSALNEVLSYDPSLGVLYGGDKSGAGGDDSSTWIIAVAIAVPVAIGKRPVPFCQTREDLTPNSWSFQLQWPWLWWW